ncbi:MAG: isoprenylcysteine carboxylmethyltransferase family protein [Ketobacteraceae bacterium]|nr:isoprenylcysteine carboxylmethyltransferase family protein [Ketobacteraceae bacterium]
MFFKSGARKNLKWFVSCIPMFVLPFLLLFLFFTRDAYPLEGWLAYGATILAVISCLASVLLINWAVLTHAEPIPLWHQESHQMPSTIIVSGPYGVVRHPFYLAYILLYFATFLATLHWLAAALLIWGIAANYLTARKEELTIMASGIAADYGQYRERVGMLFPKLSRSRRA